MNQITFDPNGGDLGRAEFKYTTPLEFTVVVPHIAYILEQIYLDKLSKLPCRYAFEFSSTHRSLIEFAMASVKLPDHVRFYEVDGIKLFQIRGVSGGLASSLICYLVTISRD